MRRAQRLRQEREFAAVYRRGHPFRNDLFVLRALRTERPLSRVGFTVGKSTGNAVVRNRIKRRLREAVRSLPLAPGWDLVLNVRRGAATADFRQLRQTLAELATRAGVLRDEKGASLG